MNCRRWMLPNDNVYCVAQNCRLMNLLSEYDPLSMPYANVAMMHLLNLQLALIMCNFHLIGCELNRMKLSRLTDHSIPRCVKPLSMLFVMFAHSMNDSCHMSNGSQKSNQVL